MKSITKASRVNNALHVIRQMNNSMTLAIFNYPDDASTTAQFTSNGCGGVYNLARQLPIPPHQSLYRNLAPNAKLRRTQINDFR
jgi:hypothetical protein